MVKWSLKVVSIKSQACTKKISAFACFAICTAKSRALLALEEKSVGTNIFFIKPGF
jgi:hypothetical protein